MQLANEYRVQVHAFLCYDAPMPVEVACEPKEEGGEAEVEEQYSWWVGAVVVVCCPVWVGGVWALCGLACGREVRWWVGVWAWTAAAGAAMACC